MRRSLALQWLQASAFTSVNASGGPFYLLDPQSFAAYYNDSHTLEWARENVPFFEASEQSLTEAYAYRWRVFKQHIVLTNGSWLHPPPSYVVTEFLPHVGQAGIYNTIVCAAFHHIAEGRWLRNTQIPEDYAAFWMRGGGDPRRYTFPAANSLVELSRTQGSLQLALSLLPDLESNFAEWVKSNYIAERGLFFQTDTADGGEDSISGAGLRTSINMAMVAEQKALALLHTAAGNATAADKYTQNATALLQRTIAQLWMPDMQFFGSISWPYGGHRPEAKTKGWIGTGTGTGDTVAAGVDSRLGSRCPSAPSWKNGSLVPVRELFALSIPYYLHVLPVTPTSDSDDAALVNSPDANLANLDANFSRMWLQLLDADGFPAKFGPRTAERRNRWYNFSGCDHPCKWNAPSWPFETSRTISALANMLTAAPSLFPATSGAGAGAGAGADPAVEGRALHFSLLLNYTRSIVNSTAINPEDVDGNPVPAHPWVGEDIHPDDGYWLARDAIYQKQSKDRNRGWMYNHASYCDLAISGLVGIRSSLNSDVVTIHPLAPSGEEKHALQWFALDGVLYHGKILTVLYDADGTRYNRGKGFQVWVGGVKTVAVEGLVPVNVTLK